MEPESVTNHTAIPISSSERYAILDVLRGLALLGIALANFPEFSLYSFLPVEAAGAMPTAGIDRIVRYLQYIFIDGKFYTIFSLLFGIGFSIIITNAARKGANGFRIFYRRMFVLMLIGFLHLMFLWSGDILMLYALLGMLLPLFRNLPNRALLVWAFVLMAIPVVVDFAVELSGIYPSASVVELQQFYCNRYGITDENFAYWLRDAKHYSGTFEFLIQGALVRVQEFIDGNRYFKVMGLFLLGFCIGRNRLYANLSDLVPQLKRIACYGFIVGLPLSFIYAWSAMNGRPWDGARTPYSISPAFFRWVSPMWPVYAFVTSGVRNGKVSVSPPCRDAWHLPITSVNRYSGCCFSTASVLVLVPVWD